MSDEGTTSLGELAYFSLFVIIIAFGVWLFFGRPSEVLQPQWATVELSGATMTHRTAGVWVKVRLADGRSVEIPGTRALPTVTRVCVRGAMPRGYARLDLRL
ncbi:MAG: hypothetical protein ACRC6I_10215, partial [Paracoccaceae bacterium]